MNKTLPLMLLGALLLSACGNQSANTANASERGPYSKERSIAFKTLGGDMKEMGDVIQGNTAYDVDKFKAKVAEFVTHSAEPFKHFTQDDNGMTGKAKANVWSEAEKFAAEKDKFLQAVADLNAAAEAGKLDAIKPAFGTVGGSCKSCHDSFKLE